MQVKHGDIDVIEQLSVVFHRVAAGEENDNLLLAVFAEEGEEEEKPSVRRTYDVSLG